MDTNGSETALRDRGVGDLVKELSGLASTLVRQEVALAKAELTEKGKKGGLGLGMFGAGGVAALLMLGSFTAFVILVLGLVLPAWSAALIVAAIWGVVAGGLALQGRELMREMGTPIPEKTVETLKEDVQWLKNR